MSKKLSIYKYNLILICIGLTIFALGPRIYQLDEVCFNSDEPVWMFLGVWNIDKLRHHQFRSIGAIHYREGPHPNIIVSMLSGFSYLTLSKGASQKSLNLLERAAAARLPIVLFGCLSIPVAFLLFYKASPLPLAFLAALFMALSPFHIALSRINIGEVALTFFIMISILSFYLGESEKKIFWKIISCLAFTFALLTKTVLALTIPVILGLWKILTYYLNGQFHNGKKAFFCSIFEDLSWFILGLTLFVILFPPLWDHPFINLITHLKSQISIGNRYFTNFFLGKITQNPPFYFYLIMISLRMNEILLVCFITGMILMIISLSHKPGLDKLTLLLFLWLLVCGVILSTAHTKLEQYAIIMWPAICYIGAIGCLGFTKVIKSISGKIRFETFSLIAGTMVILIFSLPAVITFCPNYFLYYNSFIGGPNGAKDKFLVGTSEGLKKALSYIGAITNNNDIRIAVMGYTYIASLYSKAKIISANEGNEWPEADYLIVQLNMRQRAKGNSAAIYSLTNIPIYTVILEGIEVAWVYKLK